MIIDSLRSDHSEDWKRAGKSQSHARNAVDAEMQKAPGFRNRAALYSNLAAMFRGSDRWKALTGSFSDWENAKQDPAVASRFLSCDGPGLQILLCIASSKAVETTTLEFDCRGSIVSVGGFAAVRVGEIKTDPGNTKSPHFFLILFRIL